MFRLLGLKLEEPLFGELNYILRFDASLYLVTSSHQISLSSLWFLQWQHLLYALRLPSEVVSVIK